MFLSLGSFVVARWIKSKVVKISVLFICNGWIGCFNQYFNTSNSSVINNFDDKLCTVNGKDRLFVRFLSFLLCVFIVVLHVLSTFFLTLPRINLSTDKNTLPISRSWFDKSLLNGLSSLFLFLTALRNNLFLMNCKSYELTFGKLIVRNLGVTLNIWQLLMNVASNTAFLVFIFNFSYFYNCSIFNVPYFCT